MNHNDRTSTVELHTAVTPKVCPRRLNLAKYAYARALLKTRLHKEGLQ